MRDFIYRAAQFPIDEMDDANYLIGGPNDSQREDKKTALKKFVNICRRKTRESAINAYYLLYSSGWELSYNQSLISDFFDDKYTEKLNSNEIFKIDENTRISQLIHYHNASDGDTGQVWQENNNDLANDTLYNIFEHGIRLNNLYCLLNTIIQRIVKNYSILLLEFPPNPVMMYVDGTRALGKDDLLRTISTVTADGTVWIKRSILEPNSPLLQPGRLEIPNFPLLSQTLENKNVPIGGEVRLDKTKEEDKQAVLLVNYLLISGLKLTPLHYIRTNFQHYFEPVPVQVQLNRLNAYKWHLMQFAECEKVMINMSRKLGIIQEANDEDDEDDEDAGMDAPDTGPRYGVHQRINASKSARELNFGDGSSSTAQ